ncbi:MAG: hypothetical protein KGN78_09110 [Actinomycetales bacterium]|nr:hypothetical protein [Actinomycetales bacterium]
MTAIQQEIAMVPCPYGNALVDYGRRHPDMLCLSGDLSYYTETEPFRAAFPERFINVGMAEANLMGIAAGLTREGWRPVVHTFGTFATRRALDQVHMSIAVARAPVRIMGFLPGLTTQAGVTHQAIDDVAIMRAVPGMTILDVVDAAEIASVHDALDAIDGPAYVRIARGEVPVLADEPMVVGKVRVLGTGDDLCLISSSVASTEAADAAMALRLAGVSVQHLHVNAIRPLDVEAIAAAIAGTKATVVAENHLVTGGLGSAVCELVVDRGLSRRVVRLGLQDSYGGPGSLHYLLHQHGIDAQSIIGAAEGALGLSPGIQVGPQSSARRSLW